MSPHDFVEYPRDLVGYGRNPPDPRWPGGARVAVQFVVNYEEGGERNILHGDAASEAFLSDVLGAQPWPGQRHMNVESMYEYGSRAGFWRLWRLFTQRDMPVTVFGVATALARNPDVVAAMREARWEIASHGLKWIDYKDVPDAEERAHIAEAIRIHTQATGERPLGWYTGRTSVNTLAGSCSTKAAFSIRRIPMRMTCPIGSTGRREPHLIIPYTLDVNDMRFVNPQGFGTGEEFFTYLKRHVRPALCRGRAAPQDDVGRAALPAGRPAGTRGGAWRAFSTTSPHASAYGLRAGSTSPGIGIASIGRWLRAHRLSPDSTARQTGHDHDLARKPQCQRPGEFRCSARRYLRARALGGASRPCDSGRSARLRLCTTR